MNVKSYRNVLTTGALFAMLAIPTTAALADETTEEKNGQISIEQTINNSSSIPDVITDVEMTQVDKIRVYDASELGTFSNIEDLMPKVIEAFKNFESQVTFTYTGDYPTFKSEFWKNLNLNLKLPGNDYAFGTYAGGSYSYSSDGKVIMNIKYLGTIEQEEYVTQRVQEIAAELTKEGMTDFEKVKAVNDYVVTHTVYSKTAKTTPHHIYAYLVEGKAVCQAYALLTYRLLTEMGVETRYVTGDAPGPHAWNSVKIDGIWYHLDTTWNDPTYNGYDTLTNTGYRYFLVTSEQLRKDHTWDEVDYPEATDNRYSYFHNILMGIEHNGEMYFSNISNNWSLYKLNLSTQNIESLLQRPVAFLAPHNEYIYYSDLWNKGYLTSLNLITKETEVIDAVSSSQLRIVDGKLYYKAGGKERAYELPLSAEEQEVQNVKLKIVALSEFSSEVALQEARAAYTALTTEQQAMVINLEKLEALEAIYPVNFAAAEAVSSEVAQFATTSTRAELLSVITLFETLTPSQQSLVHNKDSVREFKTIIASQDAEVLAIEKSITSLKATSKTYLADISKVMEAYDSLSEELKLEVSNTDILEGLQESTASAKEAFDLISNLDGTSIEAIIAARDAYNNVPKALQKHVVNLKTLTAFEKQVQNVITAIKAIDAIDPANAKFVAQVTAARKAYNKAGTQQDLITNSEEFLVIEAQANVYDQIAKLKATSAKYIEEVTAANTAFEALETNELVTNVDTLTAAVEAIKPAQAVEAEIAALDGTSAQAILAARASYTALDKVSQKYVTNLQDLVAKENLGKNVIAAIKAIDAIDPTSTKFVAQVTAARTAYNKAGEQQDLITNGEEFLVIEAQAKVYDQIAKLKATSVKYIEEVTSANTAFEALETNELVTNVDTLTAAVEAIKPAQAVVAEITGLNGTSVQAILAARASYTALDKASQKYVTNLADLTKLEKSFAAPIKVINLIEEMTALDDAAAAYLTKGLAMKKAFEALSEENKALVTNTEDYTTAVALYEIKNAQKTRKWTAVTVETFELLEIEGVTVENIEIVITAFNTLKAGTGTSTLDEIQTNVTKFITE